MTLPKDNAIHGVMLKNLKSHSDDRGYFREVIRHNDPFFEGEHFGQWSHSRMIKNVVKAWHYHHVQIDWWYLALGQVETVLFDNRPESPTFKQKLVFRMGGSDTAATDDSHNVCVKIPPGVLHGLKVLSNEAHLFYITSVTYSPQEEGRFPYNSEIVPHDWGKDALTVENDRRLFVPTSTRQVLNA